MRAIAGVWMHNGNIRRKPAEFAMPTRLVQLAFDADRVLTY